MNIHPSHDFGDEPSADRMTHESQARFGRTTLSRPGLERLLQSLDSLDLQLQLLGNVQRYSWAFETRIAANVRGADDRM